MAASTPLQSTHPHRTGAWPMLVLLALMNTACGNGDSSGGDPPTGTANGPPDGAAETGDADADTVGPEPTDSGTADSEPADNALADGEPASAPTPPSDAGSTTTPPELIVLQAALQRTASKLLLDLNTLLSSGQPLDTMQESCVGSYEPGFGEPLLQVDCTDNTLIAVPGILVSTAALVGSEACSLGISQGDWANCELDSIQLEAPTRFVLPESEPPVPGEPFVPQRPQPIEGAQVDFRDTGTNLLIISSVEPPTRGEFRCETDLGSGTSSASGNPFIDCGEEIDRVARRLQQLLDEDTQASSDSR